MICSLAFDKELKHSFRKFWFFFLVSFVKHGVLKLLNTWLKPVKSNEFLLDKVFKSGNFVVWYEFVLPWHKRVKYIWWSWKSHAQRCLLVVLTLILWGKVFQKFRHESFVGISLLRTILRAFLRTMLSTYLVLILLLCKGFIWNIIRFDWVMILRMHWNSVWTWMHQSLLLCLSKNLIYRFSCFLGTRFGCLIPKFMRSNIAPRGWTRVLFDNFINFLFR